MQLKPINENCLIIMFEDIIDSVVNSKVIQCRNVLLEAEISEIKEMVISYNKLVIYFDDDTCRFDGVSQKINEALKDVQFSENNRVSKTYIIPVCYDDEFALDIRDLAEYNKTTVEDVIQIHSSEKYLVYMLGFMPGFPFLGGLNKKIAMPRRKSPRKSIPAGSVGIANEQTGVYPLDSPGGWNIIGRTPVKLFDPNRSPEVYYEAGDYIQFKQVSKAEYEEIKERIENNDYELEVKEGES